MTIKPALSIHLPAFLHWGAGCGGTKLNTKSMEQILKNHIVTDGNNRYYFRETNNWANIHKETMRSEGNAKSITEFIQSLNMAGNWSPFGYVLRWVYHLPGSKNYTACFYRLGQKFTTN